MKTPFHSCPGVSAISLLMSLLGGGAAHAATFTINSILSMNTLLSRLLVPLCLVLTLAFPSARAASLIGESVTLTVTCSGVDSNNQPYNIVLHTSNFTVGAGVEVSGVAVSGAIPNPGFPSLPFSGTITVDVGANTMSCRYQGTQGIGGCTFKLSSVADQSAGQITAATLTSESGFQVGLNQSMAPSSDNTGTGSVSANYFWAGIHSPVNQNELVTFTLVDPTAPVLTNLNGDTAAFTGAPVVIDASANTSITDNDAPSEANIGGATVTITNFQAGDVLAATPVSPVTASYLNGVLTLSGTSTRTIYRNALRAMTFTTSSGNTTTRSISTVVTDTTARSSTASVSSVTVTGVVTAPVVTTATQSAVTVTSATLGGNVTSDGGAAISARGVVVAQTSLNNNPAIGGLNVTNLTTSGTTGVFTVDATGLAPSTGYSYRAYATNSQGTTYTTPVSTFTTPTPPVNLSINDISASEGNSGTTNFNFNVSLSAPAPAGGITFDIATANGTATTAGSDYTAKSLTAQTIPAASSTYSFTVVVNGDTANEPSESFFVNVTNVTGTGATVTDGQGQGTITNDDPLPSLSINDPSITEGNAGTSSLTFTAALSAASGQTVTVNYAAADGTATTGDNDYVAASGTLTFTPGQTSKTIGVTINGDTIPEANETLFVNLSSATNATISDNQGSGTINNEDLTSVSIAATTATAVEGGAAGLYTFTRGASSGDLTVNFQLDPTSTATAATDFNLTSTGTLTFTPGTGAGILVIPNGQTTATITFTSLVETLNAAELSETALLNISSSANYITGSPANASISIPANGFIVTNTNDSGHGTLRQAIENADSVAGHDTITFDTSVFGTSAQTISLASPLQAVRSAVTLSGPGSSLLTLRPLLPATHWILTVDSGGELNLSDVTITGITYERGSLTNYGILKVTNSIIKGNRADYGGGIFNDSTGTLTVTRSIISENVVMNGSGGGIFNSGGTVTVNDTTIVGNTASLLGGSGGGISNDGGTVSLTNTTIKGNSASGGGGIYNERGGVFTITNSTFSENSAVIGGGGIGNGNSTLFLLNSTIHGNSGMFGGGISSNTVPFTVARSIIAGNIASNSHPDVSGAMTSQGYNLIGNGTGATGTIGTDLVGTSTSPIDPKLGPLANNGGPTQTMALLSNSPAINAGPATSLLTTDQRGAGFSRVIGSATDIGAFEQEKFISILADAATGNEGNSGNTNFTFTVSRIGGTVGSVAVNYTVSGPAVTAADFGGTLPSGTATIADGATSTTVNIPVSGDLLVEPNEIFTVTLSAPTNGYVLFGTGTSSSATINDDDTATVSIAKITDAAEPSTNGLFRVTQTAPSSTDTFVTYAVTGTALSGTDFPARTGTVTITAGQTTADISVPVLDETLVEATETVIATLNGFSAGDPQITLGVSLAATVNIVDNDTATVTLAKITDGVEAAVPTNALFRVTQTAAASTDTVVTYSIGGTATSGTDFTALSSSVTILAGSTTADINVAVLNENIVEPTETVSLTLTGFTARDPEVTLGTTVTASANITDSDTSVITLTAVSADQNEGTGGSTTSFTFSATLNNPVQGGFSLGYTTNDGTALTGSDYTDNDGTLNFTGTAAESKIITVLVTHDGTNEIDEAFTVALGSISGTSLGGSLSIVGSPQTGTIRNDDALTVSIAATDADADENTAATGSYRITRNSVLGATTVQLAIDPSSTASATDWTQTGVTFSSLAPGSTGTAVIPVGQSFVDITLTPTADLHAEAAETARLNITTNAAYTIGSPAAATVTIGQNDFLVINTNDAGEGTLRQAVLNANAIAGSDTILFDTTVFGTSPRTINVASQLPMISTPMTISGPGAALLILRRPEAAPFFGIMRVSNLGNLNFSGFTVTGGNTSRDSSGGGIFNSGTLTVKNSTFINNTGFFGGGIHNNSGSLEVENVTFSENTGLAGGGGISSLSGIATVKNCILGGNTGGDGGGILNRGTLSIANSTITKNNAIGFGGTGSSSRGGGIHNTGESLTITNSTISENTANYGGGIYAYGIVSVMNSTLSKNTADSGGGISGHGFVTVMNSTISGNTANSGGGVYSDETVKVGNTIIAGNIGFTSGSDFYGVLTSQGFNIIGNTISSAIIGITTGNLVGSAAAPIDPKLGPLADNGGPTQTIALLNGSPAINAGGNSLASGLTSDQRGAGFPRTIGSTVDIGAFEAFAFEPTLTSATTNEDILSTNGLVITANAADGGLTTHYKITAILNGKLYQNDGVTVIAAGGFITKAHGAEGLKFLPTANLNSFNTPSFGFTAQAAISAADAGLRGIAQTTAITVNPINDAPTVVAPGLEDQTLTINQTRTIALPGKFTDIESDPLTYAVVANSSGKASAVISGSNLNLQGLASGVTEITIEASDGLGGTVTDTFQVSVGTLVMKAVQPIKKNIKVNRRSGLFDVVVKITNTTPLPVGGFRLHVDFSKYKAKYPTLRLQNASSPRNSKDIYVDYGKPVAVDGSVTLKLSFYTRDRKLPKHFNPIYTVETLIPAAAPASLAARSSVRGVLPTQLAILPATPPISPRASVMPDRTVQLEFPAIAGRWYCVSYSSDLIRWTDCPTPVQASGATLYWTDSGLPNTATHPAGEPTRFYRIHEVTAP